MGYWRVIETLLVKPRHECFAQSDLTWSNYTGVIVET